MTPTAMAVSLYHEIAKIAGVEAITPNALDYIARWPLMPTQSGLPRPIIGDQDNGEFQDLLALFKARSAVASIKAKAADGFGVEDCVQLEVELRELSQKRNVSAGKAAEPSPYC